jgi:hypothetical protein
VLVSPGRRTELRTLRIRDHSAHDITLDVISYFDLCWPMPAPDRGAPGFPTCSSPRAGCPEWRAFRSAANPRLQGWWPWPLPTSWQTQCQCARYRLHRRPSILSGPQYGPSDQPSRQCAHSNDRVWSRTTPTTSWTHLGLRLRIRIPAGRHTPDLCHCRRDHG